MYLTDNSVSRTARKRKVSGVVSKKKQFNIPEDYGVVNRHKFRGYKIKKGRRIKTPNQLIEKDLFLLDTFGERKQIGVYRAIKRARVKKVPKLKKKVVKKISRKRRTPRKRRVNSAFSDYPL